MEAPLTPATFAPVTRLNRSFTLCTSKSLLETATRAGECKIECVAVGVFLLKPYTVTSCSVQTS